MDGAVDRRAAVALSRLARRLWIVAISVVALALAGAFGVAIVGQRGGLSLEQRTAELTPPGASVLVAEENEGHQYIAYRTVDGLLRVFVVHPRHAFTSRPEVDGTLIYNGVEAEPPCLFVFKHIDADLYQQDFAVEPGPHPRVRLQISEQHVTAGVWSQASQYSIVFPWQ